jgi:hypothetical protein
MMAALESWLSSRLQPEYLRLIALGIILVGIVLGVLCFTTHDQGTSKVGIPWGADFAGFYVAAQILDEQPSDRLYDRDLHQQLYHRLLPKLPKEDALPYVHPPFVAGALRALTKLPYDIAVMVWMLITLVLYVSGLLLVLRTTPELQPHRLLVILLAISFEPFLFECLLGGQLSAVGFFSFALCWYNLAQRKLTLAGMALGLCFYKPTLLLLMLPMLLVGRQWRMLVGMTITGMVYLAFCLLFVGWDCTFSYVNVLLNFQEQSTSASSFAIRLWKYVDIHHFWQMLVGLVFGKQAYIGLLLYSLLLALMGLQWWRLCGLPDNRLWASTLFLVPVANLYFGIYDTILAVQASILWTASLPRDTQRWRYTLVGLFVIPWFTQPLAQSLGFQLITIWLAMMALFVARTKTSVQ